MRETLRLSFLTDLARSFNISLRRPGNVTAAQVDTAMDNIIESQAVDTNGRGLLAEKHSATLIRTEYIEFDV